MVVRNPARLNRNRNLWSVWVPVRSYSAHSSFPFAQEPLVNKWNDWGSFELLTYIIISEILDILPASARQIPGKVLEQPEDGCVFWFVSLGFPIMLVAVVKILEFCISHQWNKEVNTLVMIFKSIFCVSFSALWCSTVQCFVLGVTLPFLYKSSYALLFLFFVLCRY